MFGCLTMSTLDLRNSDGDNSETTSSGCTMSSSIETRKPLPKYRSGRRPPYKVSFIPAIRILKRDIRRKYQDMLQCVLNSHDEQLLKSFCQQFFSPTFVALQHFSDNIFDTYDTSVSVQGRENYFKIERFNNLLSPDSVLRFSNYRICQRLDEKGSRLIINAMMEGSVVHLPMNLLDEIKKIQMRDVSESLSEQYFLNPKLFTTFSEPMRMKTDDLMVIYLDENHYFTRMETTSHFILQGNISDNILLSHLANALSTMKSCSTNP